MGQIVVAGDVAAENIHAHSGDVIVVCLDENPTTGYLWRQVNSLVRMLIDQGNEFAPGGGGIGGSGRRCFRYLCGGPASATLHFELARPWESTQVLQSRTFKVTCT
jgi:predicted secreted protein